MENPRKRRLRDLRQGIERGKTDRAEELGREIAESRRRQAVQDRIFLDLVRRNLPTKQVYRPGVMHEAESTRYMHGFATRFYASFLVRVTKEGLIVRAGVEAAEGEASVFDEMYSLLELASLATMVAVEGYDWDEFPELEGMAGASPEDEVLYARGKETYSREEVMRAMSRAREKVLEAEDEARRFGKDPAGREPDAEEALEKAAGMREVLDALGEALLLEEGDGRT